MKLMPVNFCVNVLVGDNFQTQLNTNNHACYLQGIQGPEGPPGPPGDQGRTGKPVSPR